MRKSSGESWLLGAKLQLDGSKRHSRLKITGQTVRGNCRKTGAEMQSHEDMVELRGDGCAYPHNHHTKHQNIKWNATNNSMKSLFLPIS